MARRRYQKGRVFLRGKQPRWIGRWREDIVGADGRVQRVHRSTVLGTKAELPTKKLAQRRLDSILAPVNSPSYRPGRVAQLADFAERWEAEILSKQKPSSVRSARSHLRCYIIPHLGNLRLDQLGVENQQQFVTRIADGVSRKTVVNVIGTLSSMLNTAKDWGYTCESVSLDKLALPERSVTTRARFFSADEVRRILAAADEPWRTMFATLALTGMRAAELLGLQWVDVDFEHRLIYVRRSAWYGRVQTPKTKKSEAVLPMPEPLARVLQSYQQQWRPNPHGFLFVTRNDRPPSSNKVVEQRLWPVLDQLGIPRCGLHAFRHTHTSLLLEVGATPKVTQEQLRHSDVRTTLGVYAHVIGDARRQAVEKVAAILCSNVLKSDGSGEWIQ